VGPPAHRGDSQLQWLVGHPQVRHSTNAHGWRRSRTAWRVALFVVAAIALELASLGSSSARGATIGLPAAPMYIILDYAVSSAVGGPTSVPQTMQVDYVRVWQHSP
jgi:hypothetical protein